MDTNFSNTRYLELVIQNLNDFLNSEQKTIKSEQLSPSTILFSLYGTDIDNYIENLMKFRAIDQASTANSITKAIFSDIFHPSTNPKFNFMIKVKKNLDFKQLKKKFGNSINITTLEALTPEKDEQYYRAEIDGGLQVNLTPKTRGNESLEGYAFIEIKLFTAPSEEKNRMLRRHLQNKALKNYFKLRHIFGFIGFSYLQREDNKDPVVKNDSALEHYEHPFLWIIHLILLDNRILDEFPNSIHRAQLILKAISNQSNQINHLAYKEKGFKFGLTYNLVRVIKMSQTISHLENKIEDLKNQLEEQKRKAEEERKKAIEEERKKAEEERKKAEKYLKKLEDLGIDPDSL